MIVIWYPYTAAREVFRRTSSDDSLEVRMLKRVAGFYGTSVAQVGDQFSISGTGNVPSDLANIQVSCAIMEFFVKSAPLLVSAMILISQSGSPPVARRQFPILFVPAAVIYCVVAAARLYADPDTAFWKITVDWQPSNLYVAKYLIP